MEEERADELYRSFKQTDAAAKLKQGLGFSGFTGRGSHGSGSRAGGLGGFTEQDDDDVIARNKRIRAALYGHAAVAEEEEREREEAGYDSDSATAVQRRLKQLKREHHRPGQQRLPAQLYDATREQVEGGKTEDSREQGRQASRERNGRGSSRSRSRDRSRGRGRRQHQQRICSRERSQERGSRREARSHSRERRRHHRERSRSRGRRGHESRRHDSRERNVSRRLHHEDARRDSRDSSRQQRSHSPGRHHGRQQELQRRPAAAAPAPQKLDFERLIPGFAGMGAMQKQKAKTQYLLERNAARDEQQRRQQQRQGEGLEGGGAAGGGSGSNWTRYRFDMNAELDVAAPGQPGDAGLDGEDDDTRPEAGLQQPGINAVTFKASAAVAAQQDRDATHEAAIFGLGVWDGSAGLRSSSGSTAGGAGRASKRSTAAGVGATNTATYLVAASHAAGATGGPEQQQQEQVEVEEGDAPVVVAAAAPSRAAVSWRERAMQARAQREAAAQAGC